MFKDTRRMKRREGWRGGSTDLKRVEADSLAGGKGGGLDPEAGMRGGEIFSRREIPKKTREYYYFWVGIKNRKKDASLRVIEELGVFGPPGPGRGEPGP